MHYLYILRSSKNGTVYIGATADLRKRFYQHNGGQSQATKLNVPWELIYYEAYATKAIALKREKSLKQYGQSWRRLKERLALVE